MEDLQRTFRRGSVWGQDRKAVKKLWQVYSDRAENITWDSPEQKNRYSELNFGEKVCIAKIKGDMAFSEVYRKKASLR